MSNDDGARREASNSEGCRAPKVLDFPYFFLLVRTAMGDCHVVIIADETVLDFGLGNSVVVIFCADDALG